VVDFGELLLGAAAFDADDVVQLVVARRHGRIDSEEAVEVDFAIGFDLQAFEGDSPHRALRDIPYRHAGVERRQQMFLRIGEPIRSTELAGLVDVDGESARYPFRADLEAIDLRTAARLTLPGRGDA